MSCGGGGCAYALVCGVGGSAVQLDCCVCGMQAPISMMQLGLPSAMGSSRAHSWLSSISQERKFRGHEGVMVL